MKLMRTAAIDRGETSNLGFAAVALNTTNYLYDGYNLLEELDSGSILARYIQAGLDFPLVELRSGTTGYYQQDALGSVTSLSNAAATLANSYVYDTLGNLTVSTNSLTNHFQYSGRDFDAETNLQFSRARYYDPSVGRFLSEDPIRGISGAVNFYAYVENNPVNLFDPSGLCPPQKCPTKPSPKLRLVPISDCSHKGTRRILYELQGSDDASCWWVTEHQDPKKWAPATSGNPIEGQSTGDESNGPGGFDDTLFGWGIGPSNQNFTLSSQDPRQYPNTPSYPVDVSLPSGPNGQQQDYGFLGLFHGGVNGFTFINGNSTGWVPCNKSFEVPGYK